MRKNKTLFVALFFFAFSVGILAPVSGADAATGLQYTLLEKIPGFTGTDGSDLPGYIKAIYKTALVIVTLSAVLMISIGGFMYLTSAGNTSAMGTAKSVIFDSLIGLAIALTAWLLLNVINPDLVNITLNGLSPVAVPAPGAAVSVTPPPTVAAGEPWPSDASERSAISPITVNAANCATKGQTGCTSLAGSAAISALQALNTACGSCGIVVSGGTECWLHGNGSCADTHHNQGDYAIDFHHGAVDTYITANGTKICELHGRSVYKIGNAVYWDEDSAHWHANFNNTTCSSI